MTIVTITIKPNNTLLVAKSAGQLVFVVVATKLVFICFNHRLPTPSSIKRETHLQSKQITKFNCTIVGAEYALARATIANSTSANLTANTTPKQSAHSMCDSVIAIDRKLLREPPTPEPANSVSGVIGFHLPNKATEKITAERR